MTRSGDAAELSRCWRELGSILASRRLLASLGGSEGQLTPTNVRALDVLAAGGGMRVRDLAAAMAIDETTATRLVDRLEARGLATRRQAHDDRRALVVTLTSEGQRLFVDLDRRRRRFFRDVLDALDPGEREELVRLTAKATTALRARSEELVVP